MATEICPKCQTPLSETGAPIWETYCPNEACTHQRDKMIKAISASLKAERDLKAEREGALAWCRENGNPHLSAQGAGASDQAPAGFDTSRGTMFSVRQSVMDAIENPASQLPRVRTDNALEHDIHWKARAVIKALHEKGWRPKDILSPGWGLMI